MNPGAAIVKAWTRMRGLFTRPAATRDPLAFAVSIGGISVNEARARRIPLEPPPTEVIEAPPTHEEVEQALRWLHGTRPARRKYERARFHITYRQRDEVAHVLVRMSRAMEPKP